MWPKSNPAYTSFFNFTGTFFSQICLNMQQDCYDQRCTTNLPHLRNHNLFLLFIKTAQEFTNHSLVHNFKNFYWVNVPSKRVGWKILTSGFNGASTVSIPARVSLLSILLTQRNILEFQPKCLPQEMKKTTADVKKRCKSYRTLNAAVSLV